MVQNVRKIDNNATSYKAEVNKGNIMTLLFWEKFALFVKETFLVCGILSVSFIDLFKV